MPSPSVTAKIASISLMVTTSSMDADLLGGLPDLPPRLVLDRHAGGPALALHPRLGLARDQDLPSAGSERRRAYPLEKRRHLRMKIGQRQKAGGIDRHDQRAVAEHRGLRAGRTGAGQDAAQDLDGDREPEAFMGAGGEQRAGRLRIVLARIGGRLAAAAEHDP